MSDKKPYTNLDLETAEQLFIAAGQPAQAQAMYHLTQGWRNMFQGDFGQTFVDAFDRVVEKHIGPLTAEVSGLRTEVAPRLGKIEQDVESLFSTQTQHTTRLDVLDNLEEWRTGVDGRLSAIEQADRDDIRTEIKNTNAEIASMKEMLKRYDSELRELVDRLAARGGDDGS